MREIPDTKNVHRIRTNSQDCSTGKNINLVSIVIIVPVSCQLESEIPTINEIKYTLQNENRHLYSVYTIDKYVDQLTAGLI